jgi:glycosylphosphatidylinositol phospholipase D
MLELGFNHQRGQAYAVLACVVMLLTAHGTFGCGSLTHATIGTRALQFYQNTDISRIGLQNPSAFQAGTSFPDWGYNLGSSDLHDASEAAHWPPFIQAFSEQIHTKYPKPWNATVERIVAFVLGQVSHSVADILWHDLSEVRDLTHQGFIRAQAAIYMDGDYSTSHFEADVGAEFAMASSTSIAWLVPTWFVPTMDIVECYQSTGMDQVTEAVVEDGMILMYVATQLVSNPSIWRLLDPVEEFVSPFVQENLFDYFIGGIDDSAQWTSACWPNVVGWLENGVGSSDEDQICAVEPPTSEGKLKRDFSKHAPRGIVHKLMQMPRFKEILEIVSKSIQVHRSESDRGVYFSLNTPVDSILKGLLDPVSTLKEGQKGVSGASACLQVGEPSSTPTASNFLRISVEGLYANLGEAIVQGDFNGDGQMEVAVGAPGFTPQLGLEQSGAVFVLNIPKDISGQSSIVIDPSHPGLGTLQSFSRAGRFGSSLATVDLNRDGIDDLVVSEPRYSVDSLSYRGRVYVYYGTRFGLSKNASTVIKLGSPIGNFSMMGASLSSGDLDGDGYADLLIGSPFACRLDSVCTSENQGFHQSGALSIFLSSRWASWPSIDLTQADQTLQGHSSYYWFGMGSAVLFNASISQPLLLVSSPIGNYTNTAAAPGHLLVYQYNKRTQTFGSSSHYVTQSNTPQTVHQKQNGAIESEPVSPLSTIYTTSPGAKLGWSFSIGRAPHSQASAASDFVVIGAPSEFASSGPAGPMFEAGRVYITTVASLNHSQSIDAHSLLAIDGVEQYGRFGWSTLFSDLDHDGIEDLVVSAPLEDEQQGRVYFWKGGSSFPTQSTTAHSKHCCIQLSPVAAKNWPRLGQTLLPISASRGSTKLLAITAPRDSTTMEEAGSVYIVLL